MQSRIHTKTRHPLTNFLQMISMLLIPAAVLHVRTEVGDSRQGWRSSPETVIFAVMAVVALWPNTGQSAVHALGVDQTQTALRPAGYGGKETAGACLGPVRHHTTAAPAPDECHARFLHAAGRHGAMWLIDSRSRVRRRRSGPTAC